MMDYTSTLDAVNALPIPERLRLLDAVMERIVEESPDHGIDPDQMADLRRRWQEDVVNPADDNLEDEDETGLTPGEKAEVLRRIDECEKDPSQVVYWDDLKRRIEERSGK